MSLIGEIYDLFMWDASYTPEEYHQREQRGLELARGVRDLTPFLQPTLGKGVWGSCAKVIAERSDEELEPYLERLFVWLQDLNWPGAEIVLDRLAIMPINMTADALRLSKAQTKKDNDEDWLMWLDMFEKRQSSANR